MTQPVVIGGGIAGLVAALRLAQRGLKPLVLEAHETQIGGRLRDEPPVSFEQNGQTWSFSQEHGVHGLWNSYVNLKSLLRELDIAPEYIPAKDETWFLGEGNRVRKAKIGRTIRRSVVPAPFHYLQLFVKPSFIRMLNIHDWASLPRVSGGLFAAMSIDPLAEQQPLEGLSLADLTAGWSPHMREMFAGLARNALAAEPDEIPAAGFIVFLRFYTLLRRDAWGFDLLPQGGGAAVSEPLAAKAVEAGAQICLGHRVEQLLAASDGGWQLSVRQGGGLKTIYAPQVILALDSPAAEDLLTTSPDTAERAADLFFPDGIPTAIIRAWFDRRPSSSVSESGMFSGDFLVHNFFWLDQLQEDYRTWAAATGGSAVELHIYGSPELLAEPDALLLARVDQDIRRAFPELTGQRRHIVLQRNPASHTLFGVGAAEQNLGIRSPWSDLYACGDWIYHDNPAMYLERATTTAMAAANAVLEDQGLEPFPILPHPDPEKLAGYLASRWQGVRKRMLRRRRST